MISDLQHQLPASHIKFADMADRDIVERAQRGDDSASEYLLYKYRNLVRTKVKSYPRIIGFLFRRLSGIGKPTGAM